MGHDAGEFARDGAVYILHDWKIGGKQNIEEALVDLYEWVSLAEFSLDIKEMENAW